MVLKELGQGIKIVLPFRAFIQPTLIGMSTRNLSGGNGLPAHKAVKLTAICEPTV
jgi:hypothetical protein